MVRPLLDRWPCPPHPNWRNKHFHHLKRPFHHPVIRHLRRERERMGRYQPTNHITWQHFFQERLCVRSALLRSGGGTDRPLRSVFTAFSDSAIPSTLGFANRPGQGSNSKASNLKIIIGATIGGIGFILIVSISTLLILRRRRHNPPSVQFSGRTSRHTESVRLFPSIPRRQEYDGVVEPWVGRDSNVMVKPWVPSNDPGEQAFLSPTGSVPRPTAPVTSVRSRTQKQTSFETTSPTKTTSSRPPPQAGLALDNYITTPFTPPPPKPVAPQPRTRNSFESTSSGRSGSSRPPIRVQLTDRPVPANPQGSRRASMESTVSSPRSELYPEYLNSAVAPGTTAPLRMQRESISLDSRPLPRVPR